MAFPKFSFTKTSEEKAETAAVKMDGPVDTGDANDEIVAKVPDVTIFQLIDGGYREKGTGNLKLDLLEEDGKTFHRLICRRIGTHALILNLLVNQDTKFDRKRNF